MGFWCGNAAVYLLIRIPVRNRIFEALCSHLFLPIGKVNRFGEEDFIRILHKILLQNQMTAEFLWNSSRILIRILVGTSVANKSDDFEILQEFRSEFLMEMQLNQQMTTKFL